MSDRAWLGTWLIAAVVSYMAAHAAARVNSGSVRSTFITAIIAAIVGVAIAVAVSARLIGRGIPVIRTFIWSVVASVFAYFVWTLVTVMLARALPPIWIGVYAVMSGAAVLVNRGLNAPAR